MAKPPSVESPYIDSSRARARELKELRSTPGAEGVRNRIVWGRDDAEFGVIIEQEHKAKLKREAKSFVEKYSPGRKASK